MSDVNFGRINFLVFTSVTTGNANGDPDMGNAPRMNDDGHGIITDVSMKHHVRQGIKILYDNEKILMDKENGSIENVIKDIKDTEKFSKTMSDDEKNEFVKKLCEKFIDVRLFGAVLCDDTKSITGPVQLTHSVSIDKIRINKQTINRCLHNKAEKAEKGGSQFGDKSFVEYGLYVSSGEINPIEAKNTGLTKEDVDKFFEALKKAYTLWSSAQKGDTEVVKIIKFEHDSIYGNALMSSLKKCVNVKLRDGIENPTDFDDYVIEIDESSIPDGVHVSVI